MLQLYALYEEPLLKIHTYRNCKKTSVDGYTYMAVISHTATLSIYTLIFDLVKLYVHVSKSATSRQSVYIPVLVMDIIYLAVFSRCGL